MKYSEISKIQTKTDFINFLLNLKKDCTENLLCWENKDIGSFLGAMTAWIEDMDGFYINQDVPIPEYIDWQIFAHILVAGKFYE
jgi:hypothetical protein